MSARDAAGDLELDAAYTRIARQLLLDEARIIGFLPVAGRQIEPLAPSLERLAATLTAFVASDVAVIPSFGAWKPAPGSPAAPESRPLMTVREIRPRVVEVLPSACADAAAATLALQKVLRGLSEDFRQVLVDLGGYAAPLRAPDAVSLVEGVVLVISARAAKTRALRALRQEITDSKQIGAILVG